MLAMMISSWQQRWSVLGPWFCSILSFFLWKASTCVIWNLGSLAWGISTGSAAAGGSLLWWVGVAPPDPCWPHPPAWGMAALSHRKSTEARSQHQLVSLLFPPKRAVSLLIWNFQLIRHQAPAQRLSKCSDERKKRQPNDAGRTVPFN